MRIEFETAVLLKEKGFKGLSREAYYNKIDNRYSDKPLDWNSHISINMNFKYNKKSISGFYAAPEQFDVQMWLIKEHAIHILIEHATIELDKYRYYVYKSHIDLVNKICDFIKDDSENKPKTYLFYEQALEEAIKEALKLI